MPNCLDQIICNQSSPCTVLITDENGFEIDTRFLHDGDVIYLEVTEREGYTFNGFTYQPTEGDRYYVPVTDMGNGRYKTVAICGGTYIANYSTNFYNVGVIPDNQIHGSTLGGGRYPYGTVITISAIENNGYHFIGWYINDVLISEEIEYQYTVVRDVYIVAKFEGDVYSIVAKPNSNLLGSTSGTGIYEYGTIVTLTASPLNGARFVSWDDGETEQSRTITVTENKVYVAIFERIKYRVTIQIVNLSTTRGEEIPGIVTGDGEYEYGSTVSLYASPALGFRFVSWDNGTVVTSGNTNYTFTITGDITIIVTFDDALYTLRLYSSPTIGGYITNGVNNLNFDGGTYPYGTVVTALAVPNNGYAFDKWTDLTTTTNRSFTMVSDITQTAYFFQSTPQYTLKILFNSVKGNVVILNGTTNVGIYSSGFVYATVDSGTILTAFVTENAPYTFISWDDSSSYGLTRSFTVNENITREVQFSESPKYTLCICSSFQWDYGYFTIYYNGTSIEVRSAEDTRCVTVNEDTEVRVVCTVTNESYGVKNWITTGLGGMVYTVNDNEIIITVTEDGDICTELVKTKCSIGVNNSPSDVLAGQIEFTVNYTGSPYILKIPNNNTEYINNIPIYPGGTNYGISLNLPVSVTGYHFVNIIGDNGDQSYGQPYLYGALNGDTVFTCVYEEDGCEVNFTFDHQNASTLTIDGNTYRTDTGTISVPANSTFTVEADNNYYITDVIDTTTGNSVGTCSYCYNSFPIPDSNGYVYYYRDIVPSLIPAGASIVTVYTPSFILNANSPQYVKLVRPGMADVYAELIELNLSIIPAPNDIWNDICQSNFYSPVQYADEQIPNIIGMASETSPFMICSKGPDSFFVKTRTNCTYTIECGHSYHISMLHGNYTKPTKDWAPLSSLPSTADASNTIIPSTQYIDYTYFYKDYNPITQYNLGKRYAQIIIVQVTYYLEIVDNC